MWIKSHATQFKGIKKEVFWKLWTDINNWHLWNPDIEYCKLDQPLAVGNYFTLKPKGMGSVQIQLVEIVPNRKFTDCTKFPGAKMYGIHEIVENKEGVTLTTTVKIVGPLGFLWRILVGQKVANKLPQQMENLTRLVKNMK